MKPTSLESLTLRGNGVSSGRRKLLGGDDVYAESQERSGYWSDKSLRETAQTDQPVPRPRGKREKESIIYLKNCQNRPDYNPGLWSQKPEFTYSLILFSSKGGEGVRKSG